MVRGESQAGQTPCEILIPCMVASLPDPREICPLSPGVQASKVPWAVEQDLLERQKLRLFVEAIRIGAAIGGFQKTHFIVEMKRAPR